MARCGGTSQPLPKITEPDLSRELSDRLLQLVSATAKKRGSLVLRQMSNGLPCCLLGNLTYGSGNRFDPGFCLIGSQRFQFGDLRVELADRLVVVEVESGGGLTNLVKYWPPTPTGDRPILLIHAFGQVSANDYLSHLRLWDFVWG